MFARNRLGKKKFKSAGLRKRRTPQDDVWGVKVLENGTDKALWIGVRDKATFQEALVEGMRAIEALSFEHGPQPCAVVLYLNGKEFKRYERT